MGTTSFDGEIEEDGFSLKPEGVDWWVLGIITILLIIYFST